MSTIAVAIGPADTAAARAMLDTLAGRCDLVELRLDMMTSFDLPEIVDHSSIPLLITNRARAQGGFADGPPAERLAPLRSAVELGCAYVDVEADLVAMVGERGGTRLIASEHDFEQMPANLVDRVAALAVLGADVVKFAAMARRPSDALVPLEILANARQPMVAIAMGSLGLPTRVAVLKFPHCAFTYATADGDGGTAPGQLALSTMQGPFRADSIGPSTALYGLFGSGERTIWLAGRVTARLANAGLNAVALPLDPGLAEDDNRARLANLGFAAFWDVGNRCFAADAGPASGIRASDPEEAAAILPQVASDNG